jgi:hypothetical protein
MKKQNLEDLREGSTLGGRTCEELETLGVLKNSLVKWILALA